MHFFWAFLSGGIASAAVLPRVDGAACKLTLTDSGGGYLHEGFGKSENCAPSRGLLNTFMFFVDFSDTAATGIANDSLTSLRDFFAPSADWYTTASYGRLNLSITSDTSRFYRMSTTAAAYNFQRNLTGELHSRYIQDAVNAYLSGGGKTPSTPWDIIYIVPTRNAQPITLSPTSRIPVRTSRVNGAPLFSRFGAITIGMDAYRVWGSKVINHETGHSMCLPDLYPEGGAVGQFVGGWDMMGYILGTGPDYFAWHKWKLGWIEDGQVDCVSGPGSTTHTLSPVEQAQGGTKAVVYKRNSTTALVAEVRAKLGVDTNACSTGIVLYAVQVTTARRFVSGPIRVVDTTPRSGGCGGEELNDATLNLQKAKSIVVPGWNVTVTVTGQTGDMYTIKMDVS